MRNSDHHSQRASCGREERASTSQFRQGVKRYGCIKLGIDAHASFYMVARQIDHAVAERPRRLLPEQLEAFVAEQLRLAEQVHSCYEAGCFGYVLHRRLAEMGVKNLVIRPQDLDEQHKRVNTDRTDAVALLSRLDRYLGGNEKALAVVRVPSTEEELRRSRLRQRQTFRKELSRWGQRGRGICRNYGLSCPGKWWRDRNYQKLGERVRRSYDEAMARELLGMLEVNRQMALTLEQKLTELTEELEKAQQGRRRGRGEPRIKGIGALMEAKLSGEVCDWTRFANRRQVASYTGLCPGVSGSGGKFRSLNITRCGNAALRADLTELAWLLVRYQPGYGPVRRWKPVMNGGNGAARKRAIVAIARHLAIDLWRIQTGRATPEHLGLQLIKGAAA